MGKVVNMKEIVKNEKVKVRGYIITIGNRHMTLDEIVELNIKIKLLEEKYNIEVNPRHHKVKENEYLLSIDFKTEAHKTFVKLFLTSNEEYKLYKRLKTWKELA